MRPLVGRVLFLGVPGIIHLVSLVGVRSRCRVGRVFLVCSFDWSCFVGGLIGVAVVFAFFGWSRWPKARQGVAGQGAHKGRMAQQSSRTDKANTTSKAKV